MVAKLVESRVVVDGKPDVDRLLQKGYGRKSNDKLELSLLEALYLMERGSLELEIDGRPAVSSDLMDRIEDKDFTLKYRVYSDLRERGYITKTGFKFGAHFRVYERGGYPSEHSKYLVHCVTEGDTLSFPELSRAVRLAEGVKKTLVFAVVDEEGDVTYYSVNRMTP
jgi:tRNA-intron endonuclease